VVLVQVASAEKTAVTEQVFPVGVNPDKLYERGEVKGALNV
jgi:hypothetical protein